MSLHAVQKVVKCYRCHGAKKYRGMGFVEKWCDVCGRNGYLIERVENEVTEKFVEEQQKITPDAGDLIEKVTVSMMTPKRKVGRRKKKSEDKKDV